MIEFNGCRYDPGSRLLSRGDAEILLPPRLLGVLEALLDRAGEIVSKEDLLAAAWEGAFVGEDSLTQAISQLRQALGDDRRRPTFIQTVPRRGYRFIAEVSRPLDAAPLESTVPQPTPGGTSLAPTRPASDGPRARSHLGPGRRRTAIAAGSRRKLLYAGLVIATGAAVLLTTWSRDGSSWSPSPGSSPEAAETDAATSGPGDRVPSVAVLLLDTVGSDEYEHFAVGMTEAMINTLARISGLIVKDRLAVMRFRDDRLSPAEIGARLGVDHVLVWTLVHGQDRFRITARLVDVDAKRPVWVNEYTRQLGDILTLQGELARSIADEIHARITEEELQWIGGERRRHPEAAEAYLRGLSFHYEALGGIKSLADFQALQERSIGEFRRAAELEPDWAEPQAGECQSLHFLASNAPDPMRAQELYARSKEACLRAIALDDTPPRTYNSLGYVLHNAEWDWEGAARAYRQGVRLGGQSDWGYALYLRSAGRCAEAIDHFQRARRRLTEVRTLDLQLAWALQCAGRHEDSVLVAQRLLEHPESAANGHGVIARSLIRRGRLADALEEAEEGLSLHPEAAFLERDIGYIHALMGELETAREIRDRLAGRMEKLGPDGAGLDPHGLIDLDVALGDTDRAVALIERAYAQRAQWLLYMRSSLDTWDRLGRRPEIQEIVAAIGFPES